MAMISQRLLFPDEDFSRANPALVVRTGQLRARRMYRSLPGVDLTEATGRNMLLVAAMKERGREYCKRYGITITYQPLTTALDLARLTSNACNAFREQNEEEQRTLLTTILKAATWKDTSLATTLLEPFELLRRSNQLSTTTHNGNDCGGRDLEVLLSR